MIAELADVPQLLEVGAVDEACRALKTAVTSPPLVKQSLPDEEEGRVQLCDAASAAVEHIPMLPRGQQLLHLAYYASAVVAVIANVIFNDKVSADLHKELRPWLLDVIPQLVDAWWCSQGLLNESLDSNRFLLTLAAAAAPKEKSLRHSLLDLVASCVCSEKASFWAGRAFTSYYNGAVAVLAHADGRADNKAQVMLTSLMWQCHTQEEQRVADGGFRGSLLDRVLLFVQAWRASWPDARGHHLESSRWTPSLVAFYNRASMDLEMRAKRVRLLGEASLTPCACIVAALLPEQIQSTDMIALDPLRRWLQDDIAMAHTMQTRLGGGATFDTGFADLQALRGCTAALGLSALSTGQGQQWWEAVSMELTSFVCSRLLPEQLLTLPASELIAHRLSGHFRLAKEVQEGLVKCAEHLDERRQLELLVHPLEQLSQLWSERWASLTSHDRGIHHRHLATTVFLMLGAVLREALCHLEVKGVLGFLRILANVDSFRPILDYEYVAMCISAAERVAEDVAATRELFAFLQKTNRMSEEEAWQKEQAEHKPFSGLREPPELAKLHFLLGVVACGPLIRAELFFPEVWPIVMSCAQKWSSSQQRWVEVAHRAHSLAAVCFQEAGIVEHHAEDVRSYVSASLRSLPESPSEEDSRAICSSVDALARATAASCSGSGARDAASAEVSRQLLHWLIRSLGESVEKLLEEGNAPAAEVAFQAFASAARHAAADLLQEPFQREVRLPILLAKSGRMRDVWLRNAVATAPEVYRHALVAQHLERFPETAAASGSHGEQAGNLEGLLSAGQLVWSTVARLGSRFIASAL